MFLKQLFDSFLCSDLGQVFIILFNVNILFLYIILHEMSKSFLNSFFLLPNFLLTNSSFFKFQLSLLFRPFNFYKVSNSLLHRFYLGQNFIILDTWRTLSIDELSFQHSPIFYDFPLTYIIMGFCESRLLI